MPLKGRKFRQAYRYPFLSEGQIRRVIFPSLLGSFFPPGLLERLLYGEETREKRTEGKKNYWRSSLATRKNASLIFWHVCIYKIRTCTLMVNNNFFYICCKNFGTFVRICERTLLSHEFMSHKYTQGCRIYKCSFLIISRPNYV